MSSRTLQAAPISRLYLQGCVVDLRGRTVHRGDGLDVALTDRECELLGYLAQRSGEAVSVDQIERDVWGMAPTAISRAVSATVRRVRPKIEADPEHPVNLVTVFGVGWRLYARVVEGGQALPRSWAPLVPVRHGGLVGREHEIARVLALLRGRESRICVHGATGVGKTRLLAEVGARLVESGSAVGWVDASGVREAEGLYVAVGRALGVRLGPMGPEQALEAVLADVGPMTLLVDGLGTDEPLRQVDTWLSHAPEVAVIASCRSVHPYPGWRIFHLGPLATASEEPGKDPASTLLRLRLSEGGTPVLPGDEVHLARLAAWTDGIPLVIEMIVGWLHLQAPERLVGALAREQADDPPMSASDPLTDALRLAWGTLDPEAEELMAAAVLFCGPFDLEALAALLARDPDAVTLAVSRLIAAGLVWIRDVDRRLYLPRPVRAFVRSRAVPSAEVIERYALEVVARYEGRAVGAGPRDAAPTEELVRVCRIGPVDLAVRAAREMCLRLREEGGVARALQVIAEVKQRLPPFALAKEQMELLVSSGRTAEAIELAESATNSASIPVDDRVRIATLAGRAWRIRGDIQSAIRAFEREVRAPASPEPRAALLRSLGAALLAVSRTQEGHDHLDRAIEAARAAGNLAEEAWIGLVRAQYAGVRADIERALLAVQRANQPGTRIPDRTHLLVSAGAMAWHAGDGRRALAWLEQAVAGGRQSGDLLGAGLGLVNLALIFADQGRFRVAQEAIDEVSALRLPGNVDVRLLVARSRLALLQGRLEVADELLDRYGEITSEAIHRVWHSELLAEVRLAQGRFEESMVLARRARFDAKKIGPRLAVIATSLVARAHLALGDLPQARLVAEQARELAQAAQVPFDEVLAYLASGEVYLALGDIAGVRNAVSWSAPAVTSLDLTPEAPLWKRWNALREVVVHRRRPD